MDPSFPNEVDETGYVFTPRPTQVQSQTNVGIVASITIPTRAPVATSANTRGSGTGENSGPNIPDPGAFLSQRLPFTTGQGGDLNNELNRQAVSVIAKVGASKFESYMGWLWTLISALQLKYYFTVNNTYVINKIGIILCPIRHKNWRRQRDPSYASSSTSQATPVYEMKAPQHDPNAPDLYIPMMAFITYILLRGYIVARASQFSPDVLGVTASKSLLGLMVEVSLIKLGFWVIEEFSPFLFDLVAFCSYKYVGFVVCLVTGLLFGQTLFYLSIFMLGCSNGIFLIRAIGSDAQIKRIGSHESMETLQSSDENFGSDANQRQTPRRTYFLLILALFQMFLTWWLLRTLTQHFPTTSAFPFSSSSESSPTISPGSA